MDDRSKVSSPSSPGGLPHTHSHLHDFLVLAYFERGGGSLWLGDREWRVEAGDAYVVAPGEVVGAGDASGLEEAEGWAVFFPPEVLGPQAPGAFLSWCAHPLLFPFVRGVAGGAQRLKIPPEERPSWSDRLLALNLELSRRRDGYREAVATTTLTPVANASWAPRIPTITTNFRSRDRSSGTSLAMS